MQKPTKETVMHLKQRLDEIEAASLDIHAVLDAHDVPRVDHEHMLSVFERVDLVVALLAHPPTPADRP